MEDIDNKDSFKKRLWDFLGSRDLSVFIFVMACTYSLILVIFATVIPTPWVNRIAWLLPFKVLYLLFFINIIICEIKWIPVTLRRCKKPTIPRTKEDLERFRHKVTVQSSEFGVQSLGRYLRRSGYNVQGTDASCLTSHTPPVLYAYIGRFSPLGNVLFHTGFLFLLLGVWVGIFSSFDGTALLAEGQDLMGTRAEYTSVTGMAEPPLVNLRVERITPRYWKDVLLFTDLKADVRYPYEGEVRSGVVRLSQPLSIGDAKITIAGIGFTPMYFLKDKNGIELDSGYVRMNLFPPGNEDHFQIPGYPHEIFVCFYPDYEIKDGEITNRSMNTVNPAYYIKVFRNRVPSYSGILKPGEEAYYEGLRLSFPEFKYWGMFRVVKNSGFVYIWISFILFGVGLVWRLLFYRREVAVIEEGEVIYLYGSSDYYHRLFENRLKTLAGMVGEG